jgi:hypothetical protein
MNLNSPGPGGQILSGWSQILAHFFGQRLSQSGGSGSEPPSFVEQIRRFQAETAASPPGAPFGPPPAAQPAPGPDPAQAATGAPAVVHHLRPIYFGQPEIPPAESEALGQTAIEALTGALASQGIDPSGLRMSYVAHYFNSPAGGVPTRMIRVEAPGGRFEEFSADWTLLRPHITATEIGSRLLAGPDHPTLT